MPKSKKQLIRRLEKKIVSQGRRDVGVNDIEELERKIQEPRGEANEAMGIEEEESQGEEAYPEIKEALKELDDEEDED
jgi:hypothetical protein